MDTLPCLAHDISSAHVPSTDTLLAGEYRPDQRQANCPIRVVCGVTELTVWEGVSTQRQIITTSSWFQKQFNLFSHTQEVARFEGLMGGQGGRGGGRGRLTSLATFVTCVNVGSVGLCVGVWMCLSAPYTAAASSPQVSKRARKCDVTNSTKLFSK